MKSVEDRAETLNKENEDLKSNTKVNEEQIIKLINDKKDDEEKLKEMKKNLDEKDEELNKRINDMENLKETLRKTANSIELSLAVSKNIAKDTHPVCAPTPPTPQRSE